LRTDRHAPHAAQQVHIDAAARGAVAVQTGVDLLGRVSATDFQRQNALCSANTVDISNSFETENLRNGLLML